MADKENSKLAITPTKASCFQLPSLPPSAAPRAPIQYVDLASLPEDLLARHPHAREQDDIFSEHTPDIDTGRVSGLQMALAEGRTTYLSRKFESLLDDREVSPSKRPQLRNLNKRLRASLVVNGAVAHRVSAVSPSPVRPQTRRRQSSPSGLPRLLKGFRRRKSSTTTENMKLVTPKDFVDYLNSRTSSSDSTFALSAIRELRINLRGESINWLNRFLDIGGIDEISRALSTITSMEWRECTDDYLFHEFMLCLRTIYPHDCYIPLLFPSLIKFLFSDWQPFDFADRECILSLLIAYLRTSPSNQRAFRTRAILSYLEDTHAATNELQPEFIELSHSPRPYQKWSCECLDVVRDVFWIFKHPSGVHIRLSPNRYRLLDDIFSDQTSDQQLRPKNLCRSKVLDIEIAATDYLASHIELMNLLLCSLPGTFERLELRNQLKLAGFETLIGKHLRNVANSSKYSRRLGANLEILVTYAFYDNWDTTFMRCGMQRSGGGGIGRMRGSRVERVEPLKSESEFIAEVPAAMSVCSDEIFSEADMQYA
ncbi:armadillo-type protein [Myxozyma melibiosi]|uniref:Armadillo-type protein n=1 Tax=Myxozyma melibiosi TaxID=54550 RepID=A0ABR1FBC7_9ASCO